MILKIVDNINDGPTCVVAGFEEKCHQCFLMASLAQIPPTWPSRLALEVQ